MDNAEPSPLSRRQMAADHLAGAFSLTAFGAILVWSGVAPFGKYALEDFPTLAYIGMRPALAVLAIFLVLTVRKQPIGIEREDWKRFFVAGVLCIGLSQLLFIGALAKTTVAHLIILASTSPLMVALYRWIVKRQPLNRLSLLGMLVGFAGVIVVVGDFGDTEGVSIEGDLMALGAAATWVFATIVPAPLVARYGALRATGWLMFGSAMLVAPLGIVSIVDTVQHPPQALAWASLVYTALAMLAGNSLWQRAVQQVGASRTLVYLYLEPVLALALAAVVLGERLTPLQAAGGLLAFLGVVLVNKD